MATPNINSNQYFFGNVPPFNNAYPSNQSNFSNNPNFAYSNQMNYGENNQGYNSITPTHQQNFNNPGDKGDGTSNNNSFNPNLYHNSNPNFNYPNINNNLPNFNNSSNNLNQESYGNSAQVNNQINKFSQYTQPDMTGANQTTFSPEEEDKINCIINKVKAESRETQLNEEDEIGENSYEEDKENEEGARDELNQAELDGEDSIKDINIEQEQSFGKDKISHDKKGRSKNSQIEQASKTSKTKDIKGNSKTKKKTKSNAKKEPLPIEVEQEITKQFGQFIQNLETNQYINRNIKDYSYKRKLIIEQENTKLQNEVLQISEKISELKFKVLDSESVINQTTLKEKSNISKVADLNRKIELLTYQLNQMKKNNLESSKIPLSTFLYKLKEQGSLNVVGRNTSSERITKATQGISNITNKSKTTAYTNLSLDSEKAVYLFLRLIEESSITLQDYLHLYDYDSDQHLLKQEFSKLMEDLCLPLPCRSLIYDFTTFSKNNKVSILKIISLFKKRKEDNTFVLNEILYNTAYKLLSSEKYNSKQKVLQAIFPEAKFNEGFEISKDGEIDTRLGLTELISSLSLFNGILSKREVEEVFKGYEIDREGKIDVTAIINDVFERIDILNSIGLDTMRTARNKGEIGSSQNTMENVGYRGVSNVNIVSKSISNNKSEYGVKSTLNTNEKRGNIVNNESLRENAYEEYDSRQVKHMDKEEIEDQIEDYVEDNIEEEDTIKENSEIEQSNTVQSLPRVEESDNDMEDY
mmetsp:Transcript_26685/g.27730  ORF Transcript_26685/g.27730 Transcript_26685/m.27730 type:complete len:755 (+) Transcript_26685:2-2266(+)